MGDSMSVEPGDSVEPTSRAPEAAVAKSASAPIPGRLAMLTAMALVASSVPLPILPDRVLFRLRGAVVHEVASRHGLSLASDAREALARPGSDDRVRHVLRRTAELIAKRVLRRMGPLAPLSVALNALEVYALGHLLDRYFEYVRPGGSARVQRDEAVRIRKVIDSAVLRAFMPSTETSPLALPGGSEDLRDGFSRWIDFVLIGGATLPSYIERRLVAAFDEVLHGRPA